MLAPLFRISHRPHFFFSDLTTRPVRDRHHRQVQLTAASQGLTVQEVVDPLLLTFKRRITAAYRPLQRVLLDRHDYFFLSFD